MVETKLSALEAAVLTKLVAGDHPILRVLQAQLDRSSVKSREFTGVGFLTEIVVPADTERVEIGKHDATIMGVAAEISGLEHGAGFVLYVRNGAIDALEGFAYDEAWPAGDPRFKLAYTPARDRDLAQLLAPGWS